MDDFPSPPRPTVKTTAARVGDENRVPVAGTSKDKDKDKATKSTKGTPVKKRAPLRMKNDAERERAPLTPKRNNSPPRKPRQLSEEEPVLRKHIASRRRVIVSRSPSMSPAKAKSSVATPGGSPLRATRGAHPLRQTHVVEEVTEVGERLEKLSIKGYPRKSTVVVEITRQSQSPALVRSLLDVCSAHELIPFESIFTDPAFLACLRGAVPKGSSPVVTKIGEASYSEVFSVQAVLEDPAVIVKIIPLFNSASSSRTDPFPDCSEIPDVVKEITLTRHMDKLSGGGFSEFRG